MSIKTEYGNLPKLYNFKEGELLGLLLKDLKKKADAYTGQGGVYPPPQNPPDLYHSFAAAAKALYNVISKEVGAGKTVVVSGYMFSGENLEIRTVGKLHLIDRLMFSSTRNSHHTLETCLMSRATEIAILEDCEVT